MRSITAFAASLGMCLYASVAPAQSSGLGSPALLDAPEYQSGSPEYAEPNGHPHAADPPQVLMPADDGGYYSEDQGTGGCSTCNGGGYGGHGGGNGVYGGFGGGYDDGTWVDDGSGACGYDDGTGGYGMSGWDRLLGRGSCGPTWFGSIGGVYLTRNNPNSVWLTYDATNVNTALLGSADANQGWRGGFETRFGRTLGYNKALEVTYWMTDVMQSTASVRDYANNLSTPLDFGLLQFPDASYVSDYFDNSNLHEVSRTNEFHNIEVNLLGGPLTGNSCGSCNRLSMSYLAGVRYFRFRDDLLFRTMNDGNPWGYDPNMDAHVSVDLTNNLVGFQVGGRADYALLWNRLSAYTAVKAGIFGNHMVQDYHICRSDDAGAYGSHSTGNGFAMIGQIDAGLNLCLTQHWSLYGGYRLMGVNGVALSDNQIPHFQEDSMGIENIDTNGSLLLHGAVFGAQFCF